MFKKGLDQAVKRSYETKDSFGEAQDYFKKGVKIQKWFPKAGEHMINIIPYIAGENNPNQQKGYAAHVLDVWVHQRVGPSGTSHVCLLKNFKQPCPICDLQREMRKEGYDEEDIKNLQPKRRTIYNVVVLDTLEEESKGIQIWEVAHWFMEKHLVQLAKNPKGGGFILFQCPDTGKSIAWTIENPGGTNINYTGHRFIDRDTEVTDDQLESAHILDEIIHIPSYEELLEVAKSINEDAGSEEDEEVAEEKPKRTRKAKAKPEPEPEEDDDEEDDDELPWGDDEDDDEEEDDELYEDYDEDDDEEADDEEDEEEDDEEEPEPEAKPKRKIKKPVGRLRKKK